MTYEKAKILAKKNPNTTYSYDAGNGFGGELYYCDRRKRIISALINKNGLRF